MLLPALGLFAYFTLPRGNWRIGRGFSKILAAMIYTGSEIRMTLLEPIGVQRPCSRSLLGEFLFLRVRFMVVIVANFQTFLLPALGPLSANWSRALLHRHWRNDHSRGHSHDFA